MKGPGMDELHEPCECHKCEVRRFDIAMFKAIRAGLFAFVIAVIAGIAGCWITHVEHERAKFKPQNEKTERPNGTVK